jgi:hypothetical protein
MDWGEPGIYLFFFIVGAIVYSAYISFVRGSLPGLLFYPFIFIGVTELARVPYWTTTRTFPSWLWLFITVFGLWRTRRKQELRRREESQLFPHRAPFAVTAPAARPELTDTSGVRAAPTRK